MRLSVALTAFAAVLFVTSTSAFSQDAGTKTYRFTTGLGEICKKSTGGYYDGKLIEEFPDGTIIEATAFGNGYYTGVSPKTGKKGFLRNSNEAKAEFINPYNIIDRIFHTWVYEYDEYGYKDPMAQPKSHNLLIIRRNPNGEDDDAIISVAYINDPDTKNEKTVYKDYYGKFLPYCVTATHVKNNGEKAPIDEFRIYLTYNPKYSGMKVVGAEIYGAIINGEMWDIMKRVNVSCNAQ
ncbi:MAG: hypothetical protein NC043_03945 [Muribaculaceae bacterium]|nr:hypothetical protein [Muribaculaceae bacterium]